MAENHAWNIRSQQWETGCIWYTKQTKETNYVVSLQVLTINNIRTLYSSTDYYPLCNCYHISSCPLIQYWTPVPEADLLICIKWWICLINDEVDFWCHWGLDNQEVVLFHMILPSKFFCLHFLNVSSKNINYMEATIQTKLLQTPKRNHQKYLIFQCKYTLLIF